GLSLKIRDAETVVIIGYSGTGKSVALKHIVGLLHPDAGDVIVDGRAVSTLDREGLTLLRQGIGYVFQFAALFDSLTVAENVALGLRRRGLYDEEIGDRVREALALVDLSGTDDQLPAELSGGMRKRVGSARASTSGSRESWSRTTCAVPTRWAIASPCSTRDAFARSGRSRRCNERRTRSCASSSRDVPSETRERVRRRARRDCGARRGDWR